MSDVNNISKMITDVIKESQNSGTSPYDTTAEVVRVDGDTVWVHIPGGVAETPVSKTVDASPGNSVQVRVADGRAWLTGNASAPPTDDTKAIQAENVAISAENTAINAENVALEAEAMAKEASESSKHFFYNDDSGVHITMVENDYDTGNNIHIDSNNVNVRQGTDVITSLGETIRLGGETSNRVLIDSTSLKVLDVGNRVWFQVGIEGANLVTASLVGSRTNNYVNYYPDYGFLGVVKVYVAVPRPGPQGLWDFYPVTDYTYEFNERARTLKVTSDMFLEYPTTASYVTSILQSGTFKSNLIYGENNTVTGDRNIVLGSGLIANGNGQIVLGKYNDSTDTSSLIVVGDGGFDDNYGRIGQNALTLGIDNNDNIVITAKGRADSESPISRDINIVAVPTELSPGLAGGRIRANGQIISPYRIGEEVTLTSLVGHGYSATSSGSYYFFLDTPQQIPSGATIIITDITATVRGVNGLVCSNMTLYSEVDYIQRGTNGKPTLHLTGLSTNFKANTPAHIVIQSITFEIRS